MDATPGLGRHTVATACRIPPADGAGAERSVRKDAGHGALVAVGWAALLVLWGRVLRGTSPEMLLIAAGSVVVCAVVSITLTRLWIAHNVAIFRAKGPRTGMPAVALDYTQDWVGRAVAGDLAAARDAGIVVVCASASRKVFLSDPSLEAITAEVEPAGPADVADLDVRS